MKTEHATFIPEPVHPEPWLEYLQRCREEGSRHTLAQLRAVFLWSQGITIGGEQ